MGLCPVTDVMLDKTPASGLNDCGATVSLIRRGLLRDLGLPLATLRMRSVTSHTAFLYGPRRISMTLGPFTYVVYAFEADIDVDFILGMNIIRRFAIYYDPLIDAIRLARAPDLSVLPESVIVPLKGKMISPLGRFTVYYPVRTTSALSIDPQHEVSLDIPVNVCSTDILADAGPQLAADVPTLSNVELLVRWAAGRRRKPGRPGRYAGVRHLQPPRPVAGRGATPSLNLHTARQASGISRKYRRAVYREVVRRFLKGNARYARQFAASVASSGICADTVAQSKGVQRAATKARTATIPVVQHVATKAKTATQSVVQHAATKARTATLQSVQQVAATKARTAIEVALPSTLPDESQALPDFCPIVFPSQHLPADIALPTSVHSPATDSVHLQLNNTATQRVTLPKHSLIAEVTVLPFPQEDSREVRSHPYTADIKETSPRVTLPDDQPLPADLTELVNRCQDLTSVERDQFSSLLRDFYDVFARDGDFGCCDWLTLSIDTGDAEPIKQQARPIPFHQTDEVHAQYKGYLKRKAVSPSSSRWASPLVLVRKKSGEIRCCCDYRKLNQVTKIPSNPIAPISPLLERLRGGKWFHLADAAQGYHNVVINEKDRCKTAVIVPGLGLFEYNVMPFGLSAAPGFFQSLMDLILEPTEFRAYLDDLTAGCTTFSQGLEQLRNLFLRLRQAGILLKAKKCNFFQTSAHILGYVVTADEIATDPEKIKRVLAWPTPNDKHALRCYLGLVNYYAKFAKNLANVAEPLYRLLPSCAPFNWGADQKAAFEKTKLLLTSAPVLALPDRKGGKFTLTCDSSGFALGCILSQDQNGEDKVIAYYSRVMSPAERRYCTTQKELLAVVQGCKTFKTYLLGRKFDIITDHRCLIWLTNFKHPENRLARWLETLAAYDYDLKYKPGPSISHVDSLSRYPHEISSCPPDCQQCIRLKRKDEQFEESAHIHVTQIQPDPEWEPAALRAAQLADPIINPILTGLEDDKRPMAQEATQLQADSRILWLQWKSLKVVEGVLYRKFEHVTGDLQREKLQIVLPRARVNGVIQQYHDAIGSGSHFGFPKTLAKIRDRFYWPNQSKDVLQYCLACKPCRERHGPARRIRAPLRRFPEASPLARWQIDFAGPFHATPEGYRWAAVCVEVFSNWPEVLYLKTATAAELAEVLVKDLICRFGVMKSLQSDQGPAFESNLFKSVLQMLEIEKLRACSLHPRSQGKVEKFIQTLKNKISIVAKKAQSAWADNIPFILLAYRSSRHGTSRFSPSEILFGRNLNLPADLVRPPPPGSDTRQDDPLSYPQWLQDTLREIRSEVVDNTSRAAMACKEKWDQHVNFRSFAPGSMVWLYTPRRRVGVTSKLNRPWTGPWEVISTLNDIVVRIKNPNTNKKKVVHIERLAEYHGHAYAHYFNVTNWPSTLSSGTSCIPSSDP